MDVIQEAKEYGALRSRGFSVSEISQYKGVAPERVKRRLAWLTLPTEVQQLAAERKLPSSHRVAKALARLPREYQVREAQRLSISQAKISVIEKSVDMLLNQLLQEKTDRYQPLRDGRPFLALELAESAVNGSEGRKLNDEAIQAARKVCELCTLQPNISICRPCPLVTMMSVLIRRK